MTGHDGYFDECLEAMRQALKSADVDAPEAFAEKLVEAIEADLIACDLDYEPIPSEVKEWYESANAPLFSDWLQEKLQADPGIADDWEQQVGYAIREALRVSEFRQWEQAAEKTYMRAEEIAGNLVSELPMPAVSPVIGKEPRFRCNIVMGTPEDRNTEYGANANLGEWLILENPLPLHPESALGSFGWLIQSQGCPLPETGAPQGEFMESLRRELAESSGYYGAPTFCVDLCVKDLEHFKAGGSFKIDPGVACGNFEMFSGAGGIFDIRLDRPVVIDKDLVMELQIEEAKNRFYTVDDVYGFSRAEWGSEVGLVDEKASAPRLFTKAKTTPVIEQPLEDEPERPIRRSRMGM